MSRRYTPEEKAEALDVLASCEGDAAQASRRTGIPAQTLRRWVKAHQEQRPDRLRSHLERAHERLAEDALRLSKAINDQIEGAPLNQLATALGAVVDRFLKLDEQIAKMVADNQGEQVIRVEYKYPDGTLHDRPYWARNNPEYTSPFQSGRVREALREDGDRQAGHRTNGLSGGDLLVAGADLSDGQPGLARLEDDAGGFAAFD
jgi:transposase-like protein